MEKFRSFYKKMVAPSLNTLSDFCETRCKTPPLQNHKKMYEWSWYRPLLAFFMVGQNHLKQVFANKNIFRDWCVFHHLLAFFGVEFSSQKRATKQNGLIFREIVFGE